MTRTKIALTVVLLAGIACSGDSGGGEPAMPGDVGGGAAGVGVTDPTVVDPADPVDDPTNTETGDPTTPEPVDPSAPTPEMIAAMDPATPFSELPADCVGFEVLGLAHSPGGSVLPNTCAPFDNVLNNPYAIRCIDADPSYDTGWPGDEWCILPPEPSLGVQVGVIPADYDNPDPGFVLQPNQEITNNYYANADNPERQYYYRVNLRMRTGSHHIINSRIDDRSDGWTNESGTGLGNPSFPGAQRPDVDRPTDSLEIPPENAGLGQVFEANQQLMFNMHHFNFTQEPMLREVWVNVWWKDEAEVTDQIGQIGIFGNPVDLFLIGPGQHVELHYMCAVTGNTRIVQFNGHRHSHTDRFGVWIRRGDTGIVENVYESFDYNDMPTYPYDSIVQNPVPDLENQVDGATSGILDVSPGDEIHFVCDITNRLNTNLSFGNEVMTGEMCILFGSRTGDPLCGDGVRVR